MRLVPPPQDDFEFALLDRYLAGECSPAEVELVRRWIAKDSANAQYLEALRDALPSSSARPTISDNADALWARLARDTVDAERNARRPVPPPLRLTPSAGREARGLRRVLATPWVRVAAVVMLVVGAGAAPFVAKYRAHWANAGVDRHVTMREYATERGERTDVRLPDGTRVILAPESRLQVPTTFGGTERRVALIGRAYFEVKHDARRPFQVRAGNAVIYDLGTQFDIRAYPEAETVQVVVAEGTVELGLAAVPVAQAGVVLHRGDAGEVQANGAIRTSSANLSTALAWTRGEMVFDNAPLSDVAVELARWYDLDIRIADSLLGRKRLTLRFTVESASEALQAVSLVTGASYIQHGRAVTLVPNSSDGKTGQ